MEKADLIMTIVRGIPYSEQIERLDITSDANAIRFSWRGVRFRVSTSMGVEEVDKSTLGGSNLSILAEECIKQAYIRMKETEAKVAKA